MSGNSSVAHVVVSTFVAAAVDGTAAATVVDAVTVSIVWSISRLSFCFASLFCMIFWH